MEYAAVMGSGVIIYIPSFIKIGYREDTNMVNI
jgi:hypothetical protein